MRILLTGGTGFLCKALVTALLNAGHQLTIHSRKPQRVSQLFGAEVEPWATLDSWTPIHYFDAVINLAGEHIIGRRWTEQRKQILRNSRIALTHRLVEAMARAEQTPTVLISGSAIGVYGDRGNTVLNEGSTGQDGFSQQLCSEWESAAKSAEKLGVRVCLLRTGLVIGKHGGFLEKMLLPFKLGLGGPIGDGRQWMSWIHIAYHVAMTLYLLEAPHLAGAFNATAPEPVTNAEFVRCLAMVLNRPAVLPVPAWLIKLGAGEMSELLLGSQRVLPRRIQAEGFRFGFETLEPALRDVLAA